MEMHSERRLIIWILVESIEDILYGTSQIVACHTADGHKRLEVDVPLHKDSGGDDSEFGRMDIQLF